MELTGFFLTITTTTTKYVPPTVYQWQFWAIPIYLNFTLGLLFMVLAMKLHVGNAFAYSMTFFAGAWLGGLIGIMGSATTWPDLAFWSVIWGAVTILRGRIT